MGVKVIGVDPHKRSHTAVMLDLGGRERQRSRSAALAAAGDGRRAGRRCARVAVASHPQAVGQVGTQDR
jgi:hypothetical protein